MEQYLTFDEKKEKLAKQKKLKLDNDILDLKFVLDSPQGRRVFWKLIYRTCNFYSTIYSESHSAMAFNEGKREIARLIMDEIRQVKPILIEQMYNEELSKKNKIKE